MKKLLILTASVALMLSCDNKESAVQQNETITAPAADSVIEGDNITVENTPNTESKATPDAATGKPAINPEHGQPYHRCDIPVGAPMDGVPQNSVPQILPPQPGNTPGFNTSPIPPALTVPNTTDNAPGPKPLLNPPHGEPHHRCDLPVGEPLN